MTSCVHWISTAPFSLRFYFPVYHTRASVTHTQALTYLDNHHRVLSSAFISTLRLPRFCLDLIFPSCFGLPLVLCLNGLNAINIFVIASGALFYTRKTTVSVFHLRPGQARRKFKVSWEGERSLSGTYGLSEVYFGVTLDLSLIHI